MSLTSSPVPSGKPSLPVHSEKIPATFIPPTCTKRLQKPTLTFRLKCCAQAKNTVRSTVATFPLISLVEVILPPSLSLEGYDRQYDLLTLNLSVFWHDEPPMEMALTVRLTEDGYQYLSYLPR